MPLRDDLFLEDQTPVTASVDLDALRGIGDPMQRDTDDFVMSFGTSDVPAPTKSWTKGAAVEYTTPDGVRRVGTIRKRHSDSEWLVKLADDSTFHIVPETQLRDGATRETIKDIIANADQWTERHAPEHLSDTDFRITIDYGQSNKVPSNDALCGYVARKYAARVLDAEHAGPGKLAVVCSASVDQVSPTDPTSTAEPGTETEEIEGTGKIGFVTESLRRVATLNPQYDVVAGSVVEDATSITATFELQTNDGGKLYLSPRGTITPVISDDVVPAVGHMSYDGTTLTAALSAAHGQVALDAYGITVQAGVEPPYTSGDGALTSREDESGAFETGDYVVKADMDVTAAPPPAEQAYTREQWEQERARYEMRDQTADEAKERRKQQQQQQAQPPPQEWMTPTASEEDGEVREEIAGPGEVVAVDQRAKDYWSKYFSDGYGKKLTDPPKRRNATRDQIIASWIIHQDREPTQDELIRAMAVLKSKRTAMAALNKQAQEEEGKPGYWQRGKEFLKGLVPSGGKESLVTARDIITGLMGAGEDVTEQVDRLVGDYIASEPGVLSQLDRTIYARLLANMLKDNSYSDSVQKLFSRHVDPTKISPADPTRAPVQPAGPQPERTPGGGQDVDLGGEPARTHPELVEDLQAPPAKPPVHPAAETPPPGQQPPGLVQRGIEKMKNIKMPTLDPGKRKVDRAVERAGNRQPAKGDMAAMAPRVERRSSDGQYLCLSLVWDPEDTDAMSSGNIKHQLISYVKGLESRKEYMDYGTLGKVRFTEFDADLGMAEVKVRSSEADAAPDQVVLVDDEGHRDSDA